MWKEIAFVSTERNKTLWQNLVRNVIDVILALPYLMAIALFILSIIAIVSILISDPGLKGFDPRLGLQHWGP